MNIIATVTARAELSTVPDRADAVDFRVTVGDVTVSVTLLVDPFSGQLDVWGHPDQWCSDYRAALALGVSEIVAACRAAAV